MCGIFGITIKNNERKKYDDFEHDFKLLFSLSEVRGRDSAGFAMLSGRQISILKRIIKPSLMLKDPEFEKILKASFNTKENSPSGESFLNALGHCRLVTNGSHSVHENNHPIAAGHIVGVHNGIVLNCDQLVDVDNINIKNNIKKISPITTESGLSYSDTRSLYSAINSVYQRTGDIQASVSDVFNRIDGSASIAFLSDENYTLTLATNTGSLYYLIDKEIGIFVFASEKKILKDFCKKSRLLKLVSSLDIKQLEAGSGILNECLEIKKFYFKDKYDFGDKLLVHKHRPVKILDIVSDVSNIKRCAKCILPSTYPFIEFDEKGVCNFCNRHVNQHYFGEAKLEELLDKYRSKNGEHDCLVGLSGGRDSSYGMHLIKNKYRMHPIAYTYDWGLTTDTSRRNQAKICGRLGIEHIIRSPDIQKKRRHIRKNIFSWLKNPNLGMVPLFMAGDKDFYQFGRTLRKELNLDLTIFCTGSLLEQREFFVGFCGVNENVTTTSRLYHYRFSVKFQLALWYWIQYMKNPSYINESFYDSIRSFFTSFLFKDDFLYLYEYIPWNEKEIEDVLRKEYDWEADKRYGENQWRMGDGQTAFTNYIFYKVAGFSEFDNFRSNQIREGLITRDEALKLAEKDNKPKFESLQYFSYVVGFNLDEVLAKINLIPKLY